MGDDQSIVNQLAKIIEEKTPFEFASLDRQMNLEQSGLDSFARVNLVMEIEDHFGFELTDSETADVATIDDLVQVIKLKTEAS